MAVTIQIKRGTKAGLPALAPGEYGLATDTGELFVGGNSGNIQVATLGSDGKIPEGRLPEMNYDPAGSAAAVQTNLTSHVNNKNNPHGVTAAQVGAFTKAENLAAATAGLYGLGSDAVPDDVLKLIPGMVSGADFANRVMVPFYESGNFVGPSDALNNEATVICVGGGGGGAGRNSNGGGGGGGGYITIAQLTLTPGQSYPVVIGAGGLGRTEDNSATDGGTTSFGGTLCVANGGKCGNGVNGGDGESGGGAGTNGTGGNGGTYGGGGGGPSTPGSGGTYGGNGGTRDSFPTKGAGFGDSLSWLYPFFVSPDNLTSLPYDDDTYSGGGGGYGGRGGYGTKNVSGGGGGGYCGNGGRGGASGGGGGGFGGNGGDSDGGPGGGGGFFANGGNGTDYDGGPGEQPGGGGAGGNGSTRNGGDGGDGGCFIFYTKVGAAA